MNAYQTMERKFLGLAFFLGPLLLLGAFVALFLGIDRSPYAYMSGMEGLLSIFGALFMLPVLLELARVLGERAPLWGIISKVMAIAWITIMVPFSMRMIEVDLINAGFDQGIFQIESLYSGWIPFFIVHTLSMFTPLVLGIGFLRTGSIPRSSAISLIFACFFLGLSVMLPSGNTLQLGNIFSLLTSLAYLIAFVPLGLRYLFSGPQVDVADVAMA